MLTLPSAVSVSLALRVPLTVLQVLFGEIKVYPPTSILGSLLEVISRSNDGHANSLPST